MSAPAKVLVVGAGTRFLSGITYYTHALTLALAQDRPTSVLLLRRLLPARFYPGRARVGAELSTLDYPADVAVHDGLDWSWGRSLVPTLRFLSAQAPDVIVLQWWTGTVLHSYLLIAAWARRRGVPVIIEFHEAQDVGELGIPLAGGYVRKAFPWLLRRCSGAVVHSEFDRALIIEHYGRGGEDVLGALPVRVIPHGPYRSGPSEPRETGTTDGSPANDVVHLLYFGVIRPFKGVEDLLRAFAMLTPEQAAGYALTIAGETWEGWTLPGELIADHPFRAQITFLNRYVSDAELADLLAAADAMVLPYHRSSSSGPLQMAMGEGLPVIVTAVGGLREAAANYSGAIFVPPQQPAAIAAALPQLSALIGAEHASPVSWEVTRDGYGALIDELLASPAGLAGPADAAVRP